MAMPNASRNSGRGRSRYNTHAMSVTTIGARFASSVETAMDVMISDQCHRSRSPAKNSPAQKIA